MPTTPINGVEHFYQRAGVGEPVVFVHGGFPCLQAVLTLPPGSEWEWTWEKDFARRFDFVWYDRRGCHHSSRPVDNDFLLKTQARDLEGLLDRLHISAAHVIGSSAGGPISVVFAATRPERVRSLVLAGTGLHLFPLNDPVTQIICQQIALLDREGADVAFDRRPAGVEATFGVLWDRAEAEKQGRLREYLEDQVRVKEQAGQLPRAELRAMQPYIQASVRHHAGRIRALTLVLHGEDDATVPLAWGEELAYAIPSARLQVIPGGPHGVIHRTEEGMNAAIAFIEAVTAG